MRRNPILSLFLSVILPSIILQKGAPYLGGPTHALWIALMFPLADGAIERVREKKLSLIAGLGICNVLLSGFFAVAQITGHWFALKEAVLPVILGLLAYFTAHTEKNILTAMLLNPSVFNFNKLNEALAQQNRSAEFAVLLTKSNRYFAGSFFVSGFVNWLMGFFIFTPIDSALTSEARSEMLNSQLGTMTQWSIVGLMIPLMIFLIFFLRWFSKQVHALSGFTLDDLMIEKKKKEPAKPL